MPLGELGAVLPQDERAVGVLRLLMMVVCGWLIFVWWNDGWVRRAVGGGGCGAGGVRKMERCTGS